MCLNVRITVVSYWSPPVSSSHCITRGDEWEQIRSNRHKGHSIFRHRLAIRLFSITNICVIVTTSCRHELHHFSYLLLLPYRSPPILFSIKSNWENEMAAIRYFRDNAFRVFRQYWAFSYVTGQPTDTASRHHVPDDSTDISMSPHYLVNTGRVRTIRPLHDRLLFKYFAWPPTIGHGRNRARIFYHRRPASAVIGSLQ